MNGATFFEHGWRSSTLLLALFLGSASGQTGGAKKGEAPGAARDAHLTVVVYNESDRDSRELARFYAAKRGIAKDHLIGLRCGTEEDISRPDFDRQIAAPLRKTFEKRGWWQLRAGDHPMGRVERTSIRFLALMRGIPLRIKPHFEPYPGDRIIGRAELSSHNEAAVDSELAVLGLYSGHISGELNNPYFRAFARITETNIPSLLLVCRLDGPSPEIVRQMINDSLAAEQRGLRGFAYVDALGTADEGRKIADVWLRNIAETARKKGSPVIFDNIEAMFPPPYPMRSVALYFGWYAQDVAGPFTRPDFRFQRGAVAVHIHSFSAQSLRDPRRFWCAPLLAKGAAATLGNVYEPYLGLTPALDIFHDRLRAGFTFAESAYMSQRFLSWMNTFVGDPLYRPFQAEIDLSKGRMPRDEWENYSAGARTWFAEGPAAGTAALETSGNALKSGLIFEGLGLLQVAASQPEPAVQNFSLAARLYQNPEDILRVTIHEVLQLEALNRVPEALALARKRIAAFPTTPAVEMLKSIEFGMAAAHPTAAQSTGAPR